MRIWLLRFKRSPFDHVVLLVVVGRVICTGWGYSRPILLLSLGTGLVYVVGGVYVLLLNP